MKVGTELEDLLAEIVGRIGDLAARGRVATYIPELANADIRQFGIAVAPVGGATVVAGDGDVHFSIQSISKVFTLALALDRIGSALWRRVGREPSGDPFNSIVQLEYERGVPRNPFINAGAIVVADVLLDDRTPNTALDEVLRLCQRLARDKSVTIDQKVAASEMQTGSRNRALANFMLAEGNLKGDVENVLRVYFEQCSISMTCRQLATAGRSLAACETQGSDSDPIITADRARRLCALMMTCGLYDASGEFAYRGGIPAKSGVGGGILAIVPGIAAIAAWSPGLDDKGNSLLALLAIEELIRHKRWSVFSP
ncbi:MAG: glutaminase [Hyphomicrobiaceae bacterium]